MSILPRLFKRPAPRLADGSESGYPPDGIIELRYKFEPVARRFRRNNRLSYLVSLSLVLGLGIGVLTGVGGPSAGVGICVMCLFALIVLFQCLIPQLRCPGCLERLDSGLGEYCPECGHRGWLYRSNFLAWMKCSACGANLWGYRVDNGLHNGNRSYRIRACTYCGLPLDEDGV